MTYTDSDAAEYEFDWQNPKHKSFDVGGVVSGTFRALRSNIRPFFILTFFGAGIPMMLFSLWPILFGMESGINFLDPTWAEDIEWESFLGSFLSLFLVILIFSIFITGAMIQLSVTALNDRPVDFRAAIGTGLRLFFPIFAMFIIYIISVFIGFMVLIIPGVFVWLGWALAMNIRVIEGGSFLGAFSRSWTLSKGYKRWILLMLIIFGVLGAVIGLVFQLPVLFFGNSQTAMIEGGTRAYWVANAIGTGFSQMITVALSAVGLTATYLEIRRVKEGVESDKLADIFS